MAERLRTIVRTVANELDKYRVRTLNEAIATVGSASERTQKRLNDAQTVLSSKCEVVTKQIADGTTIFQELRKSGVEVRPEVRLPPLPTRIIKWWQWYQQLIGLDTVEVCKQQVNLAQDRLFNCQYERRQLNRDATMKNEKLKEVYAELLQTKRDDPRYVQLTILENKSLQDLGKIVSKLNLLEREEKEHFTLLATAIKEYHVSQDMYTQRYKYISIVASTLLAILSLIASMIYNNKRIVDVRIILSEALERNKLSVDARISEVIQKLDDANWKGHLPNDNPMPQLKTVVSKEPTSLLEQISSKMGIDKTYVAIGLGLFGIYLIRAIFN